MPIPKPVLGPRRRPGRSRLAVVGVAAVAALADWAILAPLAGLHLTARQGGIQHIGAITVVVATVVISFLGWALLAILERRTPRRPHHLDPLANGIGTSAKLGLSSLHLLVGAVVIYGFRRTAAERR
ncbi:MAG TPA: DUF6069 family protein [Kribbella sp.]|nr:DUF6069 family protein [Kribbella sp.]